MEHRFGNRKELNLKVELKINGTVIGRYSTKDVSLGGMGLYGAVEEIARYSVVSVCMVPDIPDSRERAEIRAVVIHQNNNTIGLMWREHDFILPEALEKIWHCEKTPATLRLFA